MNTQKIFFLCLLPLLLCACNVGDLLPGHVKQGYVSTNEPGTFQATYDRFNGTDWAPLELTSGQQVRINYRITMTLGSLQVTVMDPKGGTIWVKAFLQDDQGEYVFRAKTSGEYALLVEGKQAAGAYDFTWIME